MSSEPKHLRVKSKCKNKNKKKYSVCKGLRGLHFAVTGLSRVAIAWRGKNNKKNDIKTED